MNLFIVDDNPMVVIGLRQYLTTRFGDSLAISTFSSGETALEKLDGSTNIVILDYYLEGENGNEVLRSIKAVNPKTEVIMLSANENIGIAIESFRNGAADYVVKGDKAWKKVTSLVYKSLTYPLRIMVREFGINKYVGMFLLTFMAMGMCVFFALKFIS